MFKKIILSIILCFSLMPICFGKDNDVIFYKDEIVITTEQIPPEAFNDRKRWAFELIKPILDKNPCKITLVYKTSDDIYKKTVSASNIYIKAFLEKKITKTQFIDSLSIELIDLKKPEFRDEFFKVSPGFPTQKEIIAEDLKKLADIYRISSKNDEAINVYKQALNFNPKDDRIVYWLLKLYEQKKDEKNVEIYKQKLQEQ
jgi:tetratricopeptide (TPR) repeat protein